MKVIISGGLGNQMFQYALYLALKHKKKNIKLDLSLYLILKMHNGYELGKCFKVDDFREYSNSCYLFFIRLILKYKPKWLLFQDRLKYDEKVFATNCIYLNGYWQSEKYFSNIENEVRETFKFNVESKEVLLLSSEMRVKNSISLHLRRGDYCDNKIYNGTCDKAYYINAIELITSKLSNLEDIIFYIFSDDKKYAAEFVKDLNFTFLIVDFNVSENSYLDMFLMSRCKHNIIANSSFSWWGAWLNENPEKIVISPSRWFSVGSEESYKDIVPVKWIKL